MDINEKFQTMGVLLLLDAPKGLQFGIDNITWNVGHKFKGVKLIPLGTHIIAYSLASENNQFKISKFIHFSSNSNVHIYQWNEQYQMFLQMKGQEAEGYRNGVRQYHFDCHLGPYPQENYPFWLKNTNYIAKEVLSKLDPIEKINHLNQQYSKKGQQKQVEEQIAELAIDEEEENDEQEIKEDSEEEEKEKKESVGRFKPLAGTIYYSEIPRTLTKAPHTITKLNLDKAEILFQIINREWKSKPDHFLGQLQYSFISFIVAEVEKSLSQWKKIVNLIVFSESCYFPKQSSNSEYESFIMKFIEVFYDQLCQFPEDFFQTELTNQNFLCDSFKRLNQYKNSSDYSIKIRKRLNKLFSMIQSKFKFFVQEQEQQEQDAPVVVMEDDIYF